MNVSFSLTEKNILNTREDVNICVHGAKTIKVYSEKIESRKFSMQTKGDLYTECKYCKCVPVHWHPRDMC